MKGLSDNFTLYVTMEWVMNDSSTRCAEVVGSISTM